MLGAVGVDVEGTKHVLGVREGASENAEVARALLEDLVVRGVDTGRWRLFVLDGSKALRSALDQVFGRQHPVQRCRNHKVRNVVGHLPKELQAQARATMRAAWKLAQRAPLRLERIQVLDARADLARVRPARFPTAELEEPEHPARQELEGPRGWGERERLQPERRLRLAGRELQVTASQKPGQPAVGAAQVQDQDARVVPESLDQQEVEREALARAGRAEHQRVSHVAGEQIVVVGRPPRRLQDRERLTAKVFALSPALGRPEQRRQAGRHAGRHEHLPHLPPTGLGRQPREPGRQLAVALPDHLRVVRREETAEVAVHALDPSELAVERHGQRGLAVAHPVRFQLDQRLAQTVGLRGRGRVDHGGGRALRLLHVRHHRVAAREPPLERDRHHRVQAVELLEQVGVGLAGRGQERVQDHGLAVEAQVRTLRLELRKREPPVHTAPRRAVPDRARTVDQLSILSLCHHKYMTYS